MFVVPPSPASHKPSAIVLKIRAEKVQLLRTNDEDYRIRIGSCFLCCQHQIPPDEPNPRGKKSTETLRDLWFIITSGSNHVSGGNSGGPSFPSCSKGFTTFYRLTNITNSIHSNNTPPPSPFQSQNHVVHSVYILYVLYLFV